MAKVSTASIAQVAGAQVSVRADTALSAHAAEQATARLAQAADVYRE